MKETNYRAYAVAPIILVTFTAIFMMAFYYFQAYQIIATAESKRTTAAAGRTHIRSLLTQCKCALLAKLSGDSAASHTSLTPDTSTAVMGVQVGVAPRPRIWS